MLLKDLLPRVEAARTAGNLSAVVDGIAHDSRTVRPGNVFVCLVGEKFDGHAYLRDAVARGATALVVQEDHSASVPDGMPTLFVANTRRALPALASALYGDPSQSLTLIGVTGTNGKTTTTFLIASILRAAGKRAGTIGTLGAELMGEALPSERTTPEADHLQALLAEMRARGAEAVAMEVSSHALAQFRTDGCEYDAAAFTNLTQDHLDFHGTMDAYFEAKMRLFTDYPAHSTKPFVASVNLDDAHGREIVERTQGRVLTYATQTPADIMAHHIVLEPNRAAFRVTNGDGSIDFPVMLNLGGAFQVSNALAAIGVGLGLGIAPETIAEGLASLAAVPGRFEAVPTGRGFHVVVDYAHTPDGLENLLVSARRLNPARVLVVFGCGGNRDRTKRPIMGRLAGSLADVAVVTSDNPRDENSLAIITEIQEGLREATAQVVVEPDRRAAIAMALGMARDGDLVLIAGKGHEDYQEIAGVKYPFDDREVARELLKVP